LYFCESEKGSLKSSLGGNRNKEAKRPILYLALRLREKGVRGGGGHEREMAERFGRWDLKERNLS